VGSCLLEHALEVRPHRVRGDSKVARRLAKTSSVSQVPTELHLGGRQIEKRGDRVACLGWTCRRVGDEEDRARGVCDEEAAALGGERGYEHYQVRLPGRPAEANGSSRAETDLGAGGTCRRDELKQAGAFSGRGGEEAFPAKDEAIAGRGDLGRCSVDEDRLTGAVGEDHAERQQIEEVVQHILALGEAAEARLNLHGPKQVRDEASHEGDLVLAERPLGFGSKEAQIGREHSLLEHPAADQVKDVLRSKELLKELAPLKLGFPPMPPDEIPADFLDACRASSATAYECFKSLLARLDEPAKAPGPATESRSPRIC
jgi:hypothetical protein